MSDPALAQRLPGQRATLRSRWLAYALAIAVIVILPFVFTDTYWRTNLTVCAINVLLAIPTGLLASAPDLATFTLLRVAQGLCMAAAFTLTLAYLGENYSAEDSASAFATS